MDRRTVCFIALEFNLHPVCTDKFENDVNLSVWRILVRKTAVQVRGFETVFALKERHALLISVHHPRFQCMVVAGTLI